MVIIIFKPFEPVVRRGPKGPEGLVHRFMCKLHKTLPSIVMFLYTIWKKWHMVGRPSP